MGVYDFSILNDRRLFGINTNLGIDYKSIPYTDLCTFMLHAGLSDNKNSLILKGATLSLKD